MIAVSSGLSQRDFLEFKAVRMVSVLMDAAGGNHFVKTMQEGLRVMAHAARIVVNDVLAVPGTGRSLRASC